MRAPEGSGCAVRTCPKGKATRSRQPKQVQATVVDCTPTEVAEHNAEGISDPQVSHKGKKPLVDSPCHGLSGKQLRSHIPTVKRPPKRLLPVREGAAPKGLRVALKHLYSSPPIPAPTPRPAGPATQAWGGSETDRRAGEYRPMPRTGPQVSGVGKAGLRPGSFNRRANNPSVTASP